MNRNHQEGDKEIMIIFKRIIWITLGEEKDSYELCIALFLSLAMNIVWENVVVREW